MDTQHNSIPKSLALLITRYRLIVKPESVMEITPTRDLVSPLLAGLAPKELHSAEITSRTPLPDYTESYIQHMRDLEWIKKYWNNPIIMCINEFTKLTNWVGDPYALAQRLKTNSGNSAS